MTAGHVRLLSRAGAAGLSLPLSGQGGIRDSASRGADRVKEFPRVDFLGAPIDCLTLDEAVAQATRAMQHGRRLQHGDINVAKFIGFRGDPELRRCTVESDLICPDGMGIVWGCRLMGLPVRERVTGIDLMTRVIEVCAREGFRPYFLGARQAVLERLIAKVRSRYPGLNIAGCRNGYFRPEQEDSIVADIRASGADCLFVGISSPTKEKFLNHHRDAIGVPVQMGVGGSFDVLSGCVPRAPRWMQKLALEWLFRLMQEPLRLGPRYARTNAQFLLIVGYALARGASAWAWRGETG